MSDFDAHPLAPDPDPRGRTVRTYLVWAVLVSVLCFLPLGLVAVVYGLQASRAVTDGDLARARRRGRVARRWVIASLIVGILVDLVLAGVFALLGAYSS